jgi:alpha-mannosidase
VYAPEQPGLLVLNDCKHGHALAGQALRVNLIRSSTDPDPFPELGQHKAAFAFEALPKLGKAAKVSVPPQCAEYAAIRAELVAAGGLIGFARPGLEEYAVAAANLDASGLDLAAIVGKGQAFNHPLLAFGTAVHKGDLPVEYALATLTGEGVNLSVCKPAEDGSGLILRLCNTLDKPAAFSLAFDKRLGKPKSLEAADLLERPAGPAPKKIPAKGILTLKAAW